MFPRLLAITLVAFTLTVSGQHASTPAPAPRLLRLSDIFRPVAGPASAVESATFSLYAAETDLTPLWMETQNITVDSDGRYTAVLGATLPDGLPADLFMSGAPRWLGTRFNRPGEPEQPRTRLLSVPYALKASDAETLGGRPASEYLLATTGSGKCTDTPTKRDGAPEAAGVPSTSPKTGALKPKAVAGNLGYIPQFSSSSDLSNSVLFQKGNNIGIRTTNPLGALDIANVAGIPVIHASTSWGWAQIELQRPSNTEQAAFKLVPAGLPSADNPTWYFAIPPSNAGFAIQSWTGATLTSRLLLDTRGNVGIGKDAPVSKLDVAGDINLAGTLRFGTMTGMYFDAANGNLGSGSAALGLLTAGTNNTAFGHNSLAFNSSGKQNIGLGGYALYSNTTGHYNTATGYGSLQSNTTGSYSTATGYGALAMAAVAGFNTAIGAYCLGSTTIGQNNTATGYSALLQNSSGHQNTAVGANSLLKNIAASNNTAVGFNALYFATGSNNVALGYQSGYFVANGQNNIHIGSAGTSSDTEVIRIGTPGTQKSLFAAGIRGTTTGKNDAVPVVIDANGQLGTINSSRRFKDDIRTMGSASRGLFRLRPVTFRYREPFEDGSKPEQFGLIAEEVGQVYPELVARSADGQVESVKYHALIPLLLNELQRQQAAIRQLEREVKALRQRQRATTKNTAPSRQAR